MEEVIAAYNEVVQIAEALVKENEQLKQQLNEDAPQEYKVGFIH